MRTDAAIGRRGLVRMMGSAAVAAGVSPLLAGCSAEVPEGPPPAPLGAPDIEAARREGKLILYTVAPEDLIVKFLDAFNARYPWIDVSSYLYMQSGKIYSKVVEETRLGVRLCDVLTLAEVGLTADFEKRGYWQTYASPELASYPVAYKSPQGYWGSTWITYAGIAWNPNKVPPARAPKSYADLLDPRWRGRISIKDSTSGLQYAQYAAVAKAYGEDFWRKLGRLDPVVLASGTTQYDRVVGGEDLIVGCATSSAYSLLRRKGAPLEFLLPKEGVPFTPLQTGIVRHAPHPHCARLFIDFLFSEEGQKLTVDLFSTHSPRPGVAGPAFLPPTERINVADPGDLPAYIAGQAAWRAFWKSVFGA
jgi:iron(III) transport system substrate-binding protein